MKRSWVFGIVIGMLLLAAVFAAGVAQGQIPDGVDVYYPLPGWFCVRDVELGIHFCEFENPCCEVLNVCEPTIVPTYEPKRTPTPKPTEVNPTATATLVPTKTSTPVVGVFCHCEQGEGDGAEGLKNCHVAKYNNGHAGHEFDYWSEDGTCDGWHH